MEILKRTHSDAFLQKMRPVFIFNEFYTKTPCLIGAGILETHDVTEKKFALVRVFVDLSSDKSQPYLIFLNKSKDMIILDLVSCEGMLENISLNHVKISSGHLVLAAGTLKVKNRDIILNAKESNDALATALLWAADFKTNLSPESGLGRVKKFLNPD